ncbi:tail fiber domain-containing protein [Halocola ammonii]
MKRILITCFFIVTCTMTYSQVTSLNHTPALSNWLGFDATDDVDLDLRNDGNADILISTNNFQRFRISEQPLWNGLNGESDQNAQRVSLGLNGENFLGWSMLDLRSGIIDINLHRDWFNVGTSYVANRDFLYCGLMESPTPSLFPSPFENFTDAVLAWGCQTGEEDADFFRSLFLQRSDEVGPGTTEQGLETMRLTPWGNVGIGDFSTMPHGLNDGTNFNYGQPRARLDVQYFGERPHSTDDIALNVRNIARHETGTSEDKYGIYSYSENFYEEIFMFNYGGYFWAHGGRQPIGIRGTATRDQVFFEGTRAIGVDGISTQDAHHSHNVGVSGYANNAASIGRAYGIYGYANATVNQNHWAGFFNGRVYSSNGYTTSDENLKQNINPIEDASGILAQIEPKIYNFDPSITELSLEEGLCYGVIAQQLEGVLPELVTEVTTPGRVNEDGEEIEPFTFKAVRYQDLIPILIAGFNEQSQVIATQDSLTKSKNDDIEELENKIQKLEEKLNSISSQMQKVQQDTDDCCNLKNQTQSGSSSEDSSDNQLKLEQNVPNPFQDRTRIDFEIPENAQVKLEITDKVGKVVEVLMEGNLQSGIYSTTWNGASHASGVYYYSLYANGQLLTKKMIKQ